MKKFFKLLIPPILIKLFKKYYMCNYGWFGNYTTWKDAEMVSTGYDKKEILEKVRNSLILVRNGEAVYERDSVLFEEIQYSWPLLAGLMYGAALSKSCIRVLDFGGSLGTTYFQNKKFLDDFENVSWNIVEQKHFVDVGKKHFEDERIKFYYDLKACFENEKPNIIVSSAVLQYLEKPYDTLDEILNYGPEFIILDRIPFSNNGKDKIKLQKVPPSIYPASYPCWFFDENFFMNYFKAKDYEIVEKFNSLDGFSEEYSFKGVILKKRALL